MNDEPVMGSWEPVNQHGPLGPMATLAPLDTEKEIAVIVMQLWITCGKVLMFFSDIIYFLRLSRRNLPVIQGKDVNFYAMSPSVIRN